MRSTSSGQRSRILALEEAARSLDPDAGERDQLMRATHRYAQQLLNELGERPAYNHDKSAAREIRKLRARAEPRPIDDLIERIDESVVRPGLLPSHAGHLGYVPGGGLYASSLADYLAAVTNEYAGVSFVGPGSVAMEDVILNWMAELVGYPTTADGNLASGGSIASLIAVVTAREAAGLRARDFERAVVYASPHMHHCLHKAIRVAGMGEAVRRDVAVDEGFRLCPASLSQLIAEDRARGLRPWLVLGSAGTADTGAIDPLARMADIAQREGIWFHADAAYGGFFAMLDEFRPALAGMERADSLVLDPHKGMFLPYGTGAVLIRDGEVLQNAHAYYASYLQDTVESEWGGRSPAAVSPELTKHFRALRVWLPLLLHGEAPFRACLREKVELAKYFRREVKALGFEVGPEPELTLVTYRWVPESGNANAFNQALVEETHRDGRVFLSSTTVDGKFTMRMAALAFRTHLDTIDLALEVLREAVGRLEAEPERWRPAAKNAGKGDQDRGAVDLTSGEPRFQVTPPLRQRRLSSVVGARSSTASSLPTFGLVGSSEPTGSFPQLDSLPDLLRRWPAVQLPEEGSRNCHVGEVGFAARINDGVDVLHRPGKLSDVGHERAGPRPNDNIVLNALAQYTLANGIQDGVHSIQCSLHSRQGGFA